MTTAVPFEWRDALRERLWPSRKPDAGSCTVSRDGADAKALAGDSHHPTPLREVRDPFRKA
jgi:hypothetical protein